MEKTTKLDEKILKLKQKRSKIDVEGLKSEKEKYTNMLTDYLDKTSEEHPEKEWKRIFSVISKINDKLKKALVLDEKIKDLEEIKEKINSLPLRKDTEEWIAEILEVDPVYQLVKENWDEETMKKFKDRTLRLDEYSELQSNLISKKEEKKEEEQWWEEIEPEWNTAESEIQDSNDEMNQNETNEQESNSESPDDNSNNEKNNKENIDDNKDRDNNDWEKISEDENDLEDWYVVEEIKKIEQVVTINDLESLIENYENDKIEDNEIANKLLKRWFELVDEDMPMYNEKGFYTKFSYEELDDWLIISEWISYKDYDSNFEEDENERKFKITEYYINTFWKLISLLAESKINKNLIAKILLDYDFDDNLLLEEDANNYRKIVWDWLTTMIRNWELNNDIIERIKHWKYKKFVTFKFKWLRNPSILLNSLKWSNLIEVLKKLENCKLSKVEFENLKNQIAYILYPRIWYQVYFRSSDENVDYKIKMIRDSNSHEELIKNVEYLLELRNKKNEALKKRKKKKEEQERTLKGKRKEKPATLQTKNIEEKEEIEHSDIPPKTLFNLYEQIFAHFNTNLIDVSEEWLWETYQIELEKIFKKADSEIENKISELKAKKAKLENKKNELEDQKNEFEKEKSDTNNGNNDLQDINEIIKETSKKIREIKTQVSENDWDISLWEMILDVKKKYIDWKKNGLSKIITTFREFKKMTVPFEIDDNVLLYILTVWNDYINNPFDPENNKETIKIYNWEELTFFPKLKEIKDKIDELESEKSRIEKEKWEIKDKADEKFPITDKEKEIQLKIDHVERWSDYYIVYENQLGNIKERNERIRFIETSTSELDTRISEIQNELIIYEDKYEKLLKKDYPERVYNVIIEYKKQNNK